MKAVLGSLVLFSSLALGAQSAGPIRIVELPSKSPLVTFRFVFLTGAASDPAGKPGLANMTASMLAEGGTREMTYKEIVEAMFPMATSVSSQVDKEMTTFSATTHADNLEAFYKLFRAMLLDPGWRADDFARLRDNTVNFLRVSLRGNNDEELGKEVLYNEIYAGRPYGHHNAGAVSSIEKLSIADLQGFYRTHFTQANMVIGLAGGYPESFPARVREDFAKLPKGSPVAAPLPPPNPVDGLRMTMVEKETRSVAYSFGFPIDVKRGHPDYPALLLVQSYLGQHRMSGGRLYQRLRELRGLNYGDYAYIEYFPNGMFQFEPDPNLGRRRQIFQVWIRPVEPANAHFALRLALFETDRLIRDGLTQEEFERTRAFVSKYVNLLTKTKRAELGYAIDSQFYGIPKYNAYVKEGLARLTAADVNKAIRKHLTIRNMQLVVVAKNCEELKNRILANEISPMKYVSPKAPELLAEDKTVESWKINLKPEAVKIVPVEKVFE